MSSISQEEMTARICGALDRMTSADALRQIGEALDRARKRLGGTSGSTDELPRGKYGKIKSTDEWGAWIQAHVDVGDKVAIDTKGGKVHTRTVSVVHWTGNRDGQDVTLVELEPWKDRR